jgi:hypothetical protein
MNTPENNPGSEPMASAYLALRLERARKTLKRTQLAGSILIAVVAIYFSIITYILVGFFQPDQAARVASGMLTERAEQNGPVIASGVEREIPVLLRETPDYLKRQLPVLRKEMQASFVNEFSAHCQSMSDKVGANMDNYIDDHKAEIQNLLENGDDRDAIRKQLPSFDDVVTDFVQHDADGRDLKKQIDELAVSLKDIEKRMDRLANATDLTPEEKKARRALAVIAKISASQAAPTDLIEDDDSGTPVKRVIAKKAAL